MGANEERNYATQKTGNHSLDDVVYPMSLSIFLSSALLSSALLCSFFWTGRERKGKAASGPKKAGEFRQALEKLSGQPA